MSKLKITTLALILAVAIMVGYFRYQANASIVTNDYVARWKLDQVGHTGDTWADSSGNGYDMTAVGNPQNSYIKGMQAIDFDGVDDYLAVSSTADLQARRDVTYMVWNYKNDTLQDCIPFNKRSAGGFAFSASNSLEKIALTFYGVAAVSSVSTLPLNQDNFTAITVASDGVVKYYINGEYLTGEDDTIAAPVTGDTDLRMSVFVTSDGAVNTKRACVMSDARIYNRVLSTEEQKAIYDETKTNYTQSSPRDGLVGYWTMDSNDISGTTVYDKSGSGNIGTSANTPTLIMGQKKEAMTFNGSNDVITINHSDSLSITSAITLAAWIRPDVQPYCGYGGHCYPRIIEKSHSADSQPYSMYNLAYSKDNPAPANLNKISFGVAIGGTGYGVWSQNALPEEEWTFVVGTFDGSTGKIYIDGVFDDSFSHTGSIDTNALDIRIGKYNPGNGFFNGDIDEVRVYDRALSQAEVTALYNSTKTKFVKSAPRNGLIGYWTMDSNDVSGTTLYDKSGNGNDGTLVNSATPVSSGKIKGAVDFDVASRSYVTMGATTDFDFAYDDLFTVSMWIKPESLGATQPLFTNQKRNPAYNGWAFNFSASNKLVLTYLTVAGTNEDQWESDDALTTAGVWYHVVLVRTGYNSVIMYVDGSPVAISHTIDTLSSTCTYSTEPNIGGKENNLHVSSGNFDGLIDEVRVYDRALLASEVGQIYEATKINYIK